MQTKSNLNFLMVILFISLWANPQNIYAQDYLNAITFDNQSGEFAVVKLMGPTDQIIEVSSSKSRTVNVNAGEYYILVRYGTKPESYTYSKGEPFTVTQTATEYSELTITLHKVIGGNYSAKPISNKEFDKATVTMLDGKTVILPQIKEKLKPQSSQEDLSEIVVQASTANIRSGPEIQYPIVTKVSKGDKLKLISKSGDWYQVKLFDEKTGWIYANLVQEELVVTFREFDYVEIKEALEAGLLSVSFTGSEDEEKMEIRIERTLSVPLIVVINKGSTTFPHNYGEISIMTDEKILADLSEKMQDTIMVSQTGKGRMRGTMNQRARFSKETAVVYSQLKYSKDHMLTQLIAALDQKDTWLRSGAAEALGEIGDERVVKRLKELFANDPNRDVRKAAGEALEKIRNSKESNTKTNHTDEVEPGSSVIKGMILNKKTNKPIEGFEVLVIKVEKKLNTNEVELQYFVIEGKFPIAKTDANGKFQVERLPKGLYAIKSVPGGLESVIKDSNKNPRIFEIKSDKQVVDVGEIILEAE
ncbi:MAG: SH3 domain-containing protein [Planctomycetota bacterium]